jgi:outer membrane receptor protein involved in Fe transport
MAKVAATAWILLMVGSAGAQEEAIEDFAELDLEELLGVVYSAAKHKQDISESPSAITVLTREDIEASGARTLPEALRQVPNVDIGMVSPLWYEVGVRGDTSMSSDTVLLLVDGRDVTMELFGFPSWTTNSFTMDDVERIEVIRGPGSALYGANAYAGVVHVITREPGTGPRAQASLRGGEHGYGEVTGRASLGLDPLAVSAAFGYQYNDFWTDRNRRAGEVLRGRFDAKLDLGDDLQLRVDAGASSSAGRFFTYVGPVELKEMMVAYGRLRFQHKDLMVQALYDRTNMEADIDLGLNYLGLEIGKLPLLVGHVNKTVVQVSHGLELPFNRLAYGAEHIFNHYHSKVFIDTDHFEHRFGLFVQDEVDLAAIIERLWEVEPPPLFLTAGLRFDVDYMTESTLSELSPRASIVLKPHEDHSLRFGYAHAFFKPTFFQKSLNLHLNSQFGFDHLDLRAPDVDNKTIDSLELGYSASFFGGRLQLRLALAYTWYRNLIHFKFDADEMGYIQIGSFVIPDIGSGQGIGHYNASHGKNGHNVDLEVIARPTKRSRVFLVAGYRQVFASHSKRLLRDEPIWSLAAGVDISGAAGWEASLRAHFVDTYYRNIFNPESLLQERLESQLPALWFLNARLSWRLCEKPYAASVGIEAFNLLNNRFREIVGRTVENGVDIGGEVLGRRIVFFVKGEI